MGGILIVLAALGAFALGGAMVVLISVYRRSEQHRAALLQAYARIDQLERMMKAITFGELPAPQMFRQVGSAPAEPLPPLSERTQSTPEAPAAAQPQEQPAETGPPLEAPQPEPVARAAEPAPPPSQAFEDETVAERIARANERQPFTPPQPGVIAAVTGIIALAALAAVRINALEVLPGMAIAMLAGAGAIAFAEWRKADASAPLLSVFGGALIIAALIVARTTPAEITPLIALLGSGALTVAALVRAQTFGPWLIGFGLLGLAAAPALALDGAFAAYARHLILIAGVIAAFALSLARSEQLWLRLAFAIALCWGGYDAWSAASVDESISTSIFLVALAALFIAHSWNDARAPVRPIGDPRRRAPLLLTLAGLATSAALLAVLAARHPLFAPVGAAALAALILGAATASAWRQGFAPLPLLSCAIAALSIVLWPGASEDLRILVLMAGVLAGASALGGAIMLARREDEGAALIALAPLALAIAAQARAEPALEPWMWAASAASMAALCILALAALRKPLPLASEIFAAGAALALVAAMGFAAPAPWPPLIVALAVPAICGAFVQLRLDGLRYAAAILGVFLLLQLFAPQLAAASMAMRIIIYIVAIAALFAGAQILARIETQFEAQALLATSMLAAAAALSVETHRAFQLAAPDFRLLELGAHVLLWLGLAAILAHRFGAKPSPLIAAVEGAAFGAAGLYALAAGIVVLNPWWGVQAAPAPGWTGINLLLLAYLGPAALFVIYGRLRERQDLKARAAIALALGLTLALLYVTLELRRLFHGANMTGGPPATIQEGWAYTIGWLGFAAALALLALDRTAAWVRHAAAAIALTALAKAALFDLDAFEGLMQLAMLALLIGAAIAIVLFYRRYGLPTSAAAPKTTPQTPPSASAQPATEPS